MNTQNAIAGIFDQICGEDEAIREKGIEYVSTSLVQMRHKLFIPHPENEKFLVEMIKKVKKVSTNACTDLQVNNRALAPYCMCESIK